MPKDQYNNSNYIQYDFFGELLIGDSPRIGKYNFPVLDQQKNLPTKKVKPINYMLSSDDLKSTWFHCFCHDYQFERLWKSFDYYLPYFMSAKGIISTDFSLYRDYKKEKLVWNCYRNRAFVKGLQNRGCFSVIPTAGFGKEDTWEWCFDGLPKDSTIAITTNRIYNDVEAMRLFIGGVDALVKTVSPYAIVVCGKCPEWMQMKYPSIKIVHIPSYSQQWSARRCK